MAARIEKEFGEKSELIKSSGGIVEIKIDGNIAYTNEHSNKTASDDEIIDAVKARLTG